MLLGCTGRSNGGADDDVMRRAQDLVRAAVTDLSLSEEQSGTLEAAVCDLYSSMDRSEKAAKDESERSELMSLAHRDFQERISREFTREKATEILAWYFNYSNAN